MSRLSKSFLVAAVGAVGFGVSQANAALIFDVRAVSVVGAGTITNSGHTVDGAAVGSVVTYEVHATITTGSDNGFQSGAGTLATGGVGTVQGNLTHTNNATFATGAFSNGTPNNLGGDSDVDVGGSLTPANNTVGNISYLAAALVAGSDIIVGGGTFTVTDGTGGPAVISFIVGTTTAVNKNPLWRENGQAVTQGTAPALGTSVGSQALTVIVPEPASVGLLALGGMALLARRRRA